MMLAFCLTTALQAQTVYDFEDQTIPAVFTNDGTYPWTVEAVTPGDVDNTSSYCIKSGNGGEASSTSSIELTCTFSTAGYINFDAKCMGEGSSTAWDKCEFYIDDEVQFSYGSGVTGWHNYYYNVTAGAHTFTWKYTKDSSVNPTGDAFFVDNINYGEGCVIFRIDIEGFAKPVWGANPDYTVNVPEGANYTLDYTDWNWWSENLDDGDILLESESFNNEDYVYYMYFEILPNEGCTFADNVTVTVNGEANIIENGGYDDYNEFYWVYTKDYTVAPNPEVQSLANWYGNAFYDDYSTLRFITFSMQDVSSVQSATSSSVDETYAACYADGYVWCITLSGSNLLRAVVDNTNHTIGTFETVASDFVSGIAITMSYNPADRKIYAITTDDNSLLYLISFDPSDPVGTLSNEIPLNFSPQTLAINSEGEAYCIEHGSGDLYQLNLSDGSATQVGNTGLYVNYVQDMAFDMNTGELFWAQLYSTNDYGMYKVNPATAATTYLGQVANGSVVEITGLFMVYDEQPEACMSPSPLNATPAATTAVVSWTERGEATQWVVAYKADGETDFTEVTANETNYTLTGLTPETHYTVKVRPVCEDGTLKWSGVYFTTHGLCDDPSGLVASNVTGNTATLEWTGYQDNYNVRYMSGEIETIFFEDFENGLPADWTTIDADGDGYNWTYNNSASGEIMNTHSGEGLIYSQSYDNPTSQPLTPDNWLITPQIDLNGTMRVWLIGQDPSYASEHFAIYLSTTGTTVDDFTTTLVSEQVATGEYVEYTADLSAYAGQQGYIAIRHYNVTDMFCLNVDDFGVFTDPWTTVTSTGNPTTLTGLDPETTYQVQVQGICEDGSTTGWSEVLEFTTTDETEPCAVPTGLEVSDITGNSATVNWDPSDAENYDLRYYVALDELENESWQFYDNGNNNGAIGRDGGSLWWGVMFPGGTYSSSTTAAVLHVKAFDYEATTGTVTLYNDGDNAPANPVGSTNFTFTGSNQFVEFTFDEPVAIDPSKNLWVVFYNESGAYYPAALCANTGDPNGRWVSLDGSTWGDLYDDYELDYTFMIRAGIFDVDVNELSWTEIDGIEDNTSALTGLAANTDYKVQVRANCEYSGSAWSDPVEFTTADETDPIEPIEPGECGPAVDCEGTSYPTVKIGDLCWMQKNLAAESCVTSGNVYAYVNDQFPDEDANVATYGLLYDEEAAMQGVVSGAKAEAAATSICPDGYRLPTVAEIEALGAAYTADELKSTNYWIPGGGGTDAAGLGWLPGGCYNDNAGRFESMLLEGYLWATEEVNGETQPAMYKITYYCSTILMRVENFEGLSASVRCVKKSEPETFTCGTSKMKDANDNEYETMLIGTQCWTKTNLRATKDRNGNDFINGISAAAGSFDAYADAVIYIPTVEKWNVNNSSVTYNNNTFGYYYNWTAANNVCPVGWHLPSDAEWTTMEQTQTSMDVTGSGLRGDHAGKLAGEGWNPSTTAGAPGNASDPDHNASGFSAVPAGSCYGSSFYAAGNNASFWSSTQYHSDYAYTRGLDCNFADVLRSYNDGKSNGYSVRCLRDSE